MQDGNIFIQFTCNNKIKGDKETFR